MHALNKFSIIFEMLFRLEIGRSGEAESRPDFFSNGVTTAALYLVGNMPCLNNRLAEKHDCKT